MSQDDELKPPASLPLGDSDDDISAPPAAQTDSYADVDPLREDYRRSLSQAGSVLEEFEPHHVALLVIDLQYLDAAKGYGVFADDRDHGVPREAQEYYFDTLRDVVLPNVARLQRAFRERGLEVIHSRIQSLTLDGRDRSPAHRRLRLHAAPGSKEAEFLPEVAPLPNEIVLNKTASGVFASTNIEYVLRNLGIKALFVTGVYTNECVSTAVRDACDLGFYTTLVQDACTTVTPDLQSSTLRVLRDRYARVLRTQAVLRELDRLCK